MSIVANVVCRYGSWVVYDGRGRNSITNEILSESIKKAVMLNERVCVAYTGTLEVAQSILEIVQNSSSKNETSDEVFEKIKIIIKKSDIPKGCNTSFLVTGKNSDGKMASYTIKTDLTEQSLIPDEKHPFSFAVLSTGCFNLSLPKYFLNSVEKSKCLSNVAIVDAMKKFCCDVADMDDSVNKNLTALEIRK